MPATPEEADVEAIGIDKSFGTYPALKDVSLTIRDGEFLTLLGPSGSGKTTFLMILAGFEAPSAGRLMRGGRDITGISAEERAFGMVFQGYALFPHMTVAENIAFPLKVRGRPRAEIAERVSRMIDRVDLEAHRNKLPAKLSGGQQQRVALSRALVFEPSLLLLDEPFSALDKHLRGLMQEEVRRLHQELGTTFVFVTHDQSEALSLSSRVAIFDHGRLLQVGTPQAVYEKPENRFVAEFLGEINFLPLTAVDHADASASGRFEDVRLCAPPHEVAGPNAILAVRPEHLKLANGVHSDADNVLAARVTSATYLGPATRLALTTAGGTPLTITLPTEHAGEAALREGGDIRVSWPKHKGFLLPPNS
ncbi:ABC transporter ATP-binding protein [Aureimonas glaciei]|uniref:ABC transporter ATP-binding protein n=1 Tax=Aureimonas glaciei TaxID=1776957 RepID=A0A916Y9L1_9HYPH|nr:ABC transporter ATP-binding protein [Aureimonas glaciei]GGD35909.1 ABC transporter ATP-binding protein [Aureimonas glaciei]